MDTLALLKSGQLAGQTSLKLAADLDEFPQEILTLADSLEFLNLSGNRLSELPDEFCKLKKLKIAFFNGNAFEVFPEVLAKCPALSMVSFKNNRIERLESLSENIRWLILTNNRLSRLPACIGKLTRLQKLMLAGNRLRALPDEMANCRNLELMRLSANNLEALPEWAIALPRLSWLAYAGNPFCGGDSAERFGLRAIARNELTFGEVLGQGASGVIYRGIWQDKDSGERKDVAIKLFKGEMTSDGLPLDEMRACIAAGRHPNLVKVLGRLQAAEKVGLVLSLIPAEYNNLGEPPSLETCTRDTYSEDAVFSLQKVLRILCGVASAVAHLHSKGIMHGDLYAHNILINKEGDSLLGDFGAASFYDLSDVDLGARLARLEVRAFGCLMEDLLGRCLLERNESIKQKGFETLRVLQTDCTSESLEDRPAFVQICERLGDLKEVGLL